MRSSFQGFCSNFGSASWSRDESTSHPKSPVVSRLAAGMIIAVLLLVSAEASVATAGTPRAQDPAVETLVAPTRTTATRFASEVFQRQTCENRIGYLFRNQPKKNCKWVRRRARRRCGKKDKGNGGILVAEACPSSCDLRCKCRNFKRRFEFHGRSTRCKKIATTDCNAEHDDGRTVADICPKQCGDCYKHRSKEWIQAGPAIDAGSLSSPDQSWSAAMSADGTTVAIVADRGPEGNRVGHVRVYKYSGGGAWKQIGPDIVGEAAGDESGSSLSVSADGTTVAVGAPFNNGRNGDVSGHVRVFGYADDAWKQIGPDIDGERSLDLSGISVSVSADGRIVAIGAPDNDGINGEDEDSGHVRVFKNKSGAWEQIGSDIDGEAALDWSGGRVSVSADGTRVAIGAPFNVGKHGVCSGHVRVYEYAGVDDAWKQIGQDIDGEAAYDYSGYVSMSADGTRVAIGATDNDGNGENKNAGHVRVYEYGSYDEAWSQVGWDIEGEAASDYSGVPISISVDGTRIAIGTPWNDGVGENSGHVRVYENAGNDAGWKQIGSDVDGEGAREYSGWHVSLSGDGSRLMVASAPDNGGHPKIRFRVYDLESKPE